MSDIPVTVSTTPTHILLMLGLLRDSRRRLDNLRSEILASGEEVPVVLLSSLQSREQAIATTESALDAWYEQNGSQPARRHPIVDGVVANNVEIMRRSQAEQTIDAALSTLGNLHPMPAHKRVSLARDLVSGLGQRGVGLHAVRQS